MKINTSLACCPFCRNPDPTIKISEDRGYFWVECKKCHSIGPPTVCGMISANGTWEDAEEKACKKAVAKWNGDNTYTGRTQYEKDWDVSVCRRYY